MLPIHANQLGIVLKRIMCDVFIEVKNGRDELVDEGVRRAKEIVVEKKVSYKGIGGGLISTIKKSSTGVNTVSIVVTAPYAYQIETGEVVPHLWIAPLEELDNWRRAKGIRAGGAFTKPFVSVGLSGGANRISGVPYPQGTWFMTGAFEHIRKIGRSKISDKLTKVAGRY